MRQRFINLIEVAEMHTGRLQVGKDGRKGTSRSAACTQIEESDESTI
jgi:hypothetical protein